MEKYKTFSHFYVLSGFWRLTTGIMFGNKGDLLFYLQLLGWCKYNYFSLSVVRVMSFLYRETYGMERLVIDFKLFMDKTMSTFRLIALYVMFYTLMGKSSVKREKQCKIFIFFQCRH